MEEGCTSEIYDKFYCDHPDHITPHVFLRSHGVKDLDQCGYCSKLRVRTIMAKAFDRWRRAGSPMPLMLWTVGTSLDATQPNIAYVAKQWKLFGTRMRVYSRRGKSYPDGYKIKPFEYEPQMCALEKGTKGGKLHYHFIHKGYLEHEFALREWRDIMGEKANVEFEKRIVSTEDPKDAFYYIAKYLGKDGLRYYWMGSMLKAGETEYEGESICKMYYVGEETKGSRAFQVNLQKYEFNDA